MTDHRAPILAPGLVDRIKGLLLRPSLEWPVIAAEKASIKGLFRRYALPLALIGPLALLTHQVLFARENVIEAVAYFIASLGISLVSAYVLGIVIDGMAETFGAPKDRLASMKLGVYAMTPYWLIGAVNLISPSLTLALTLTLGFYGAYLLYTGLTPLKQTAPTRRLAYCVGASLVWIILTAVVVGLIFSALSAFSIVGEAAFNILDN
jgi:hypothetical protein